MLFSYFVFIFIFIFIREYFIRKKDPQLQVPLKNYKRILMTVELQDNPQSKYNIL